MYRVTVTRRGWLAESGYGCETEIETSYEPNRSENIKNKYYPQH
jgi:hypothetical protein